MRSSICAALAVPGLHLCSAALPLRSCRHALGMISLFVLAPVELFLAPPPRNKWKSIAPAIYFEACRFLSSAACAFEMRFADVYMGDTSVIWKCHSSFSGSAKYIQILRTFYAPVRPGRHEPLLVVAGPPCGTICSFHFGHVKVSPLIFRLGAAAMFPAFFPHLGTVISQLAFLHRHARRLSRASPRVLAWQFLKITCAYFWPRTGTEKGNRTAPGDDLCYFYPW